MALAFVGDLFSSPAEPADSGNGIRDQGEFLVGELHANERQQVAQLSLFPGPLSGRRAGTPLCEGVGGQGALPAVPSQSDALR